LNYCTYKTGYVLIFFILLNSLNIFAQDNIRDDVYKTEKVYFYGYDFTHFKLVESKRIGEGGSIKNVIYEWIGYWNDKLTERNYRNFLKKDTVVFTQDVVNNLNTKINPENIVANGFNAFKPHIILKDSLQSIINQYIIKETNGIGFVSIIECFYREKKETSVWFVFFDIKTKNILDACEVKSYDADGYGLIKYWGVGYSYAINKYSSKYYKKKLKMISK